MIIKLNDERIKKTYNRLFWIIVAVFVLECLIMGLSGTATIGASIFAFAIFVAIWVVMTKNARKKQQKQQDELCEQASELRAEISAVRKIVCEGQASYAKEKLVGSGGWMVLSEDALEFYELKKYAKTGNVAILLDDITGTSVKINKMAAFDILTVDTKSVTYNFNVCEGAIWKEQIDTTVAQ